MNFEFYYSWTPSHESFFYLLRLKKITLLTSSRFLLNLIVPILGLFSCGTPTMEKIAELSSPNSNLKFELFSKEGSAELYYSLQWNDSLVLEHSPIGMNIEGLEQKTLQVLSTQATQTDTLIYPVIASKRKVLHDKFSATQIDFDQPISLQVRMYDEGFAFRWIGKMDGEVTVINETFEASPIENSQLFYAPYEQVLPAGIRLFLGRMKERVLGFFDVSYPYENHFETQYQSKNLEDVPNGELLFSPALFQTSSGKYLLIAESDVNDYPGMILRKSSDSGLKSIFAPYPLEEVIPSDSLNYFRLKKVSKVADYIAKTTGNRNFPWRVVMVTDNPATLPASDLILKLASPSSFSGDLTWIKPGKVTDEWLVDTNLFDVPFEAGKNTATYKYYIDFARDFGLEYIMVDEGWYRNGNLKNLNPDISLEALAAYAEEKEIGLGLWFNATDLNESLEETLEYYASIGVRLVLVDFINRNDQKAMNFYVKLAEACARYQIIINLHSAPTPAGFEITYPNAITREGVMASEWNGWTNFVTPAHNLTIPFTRMVSGSLDYEPGLLENANEESFRNIWGRPMSLGTRTHQLAMYVIFDSPLQYFVGNPSQGRKEPEFMKFLGSIPSTWDETLVLEGKPAEYLVTARLKDGIWYIGAMSDWSERELVLDLSRLGLTNYNLSGIVDGVNSSSYASDYQFINQVGISDQNLHIKLAKGGGAVIKIEPISQSH
jgi:alpha-glucosidase